MNTDLPLSGRRVLVTRPAAQAGGLAGALRAAGARVVLVPAFAVRAVDPSGLEDALRAGRAAYDAVVFTSRNAVRYFFEAAGKADLDAEGLDALEIAAVGPSTADALEERGVDVDVVGDPHTADGLVAALRGAHDRMEGWRVLYPKAAGARDVIEVELGALGARVDAIVTYGAFPETLDDPESVAGELDPPPDVITFASPSAVIHLESTLTPPVFARVGAGLKSASTTACIGPVTADAARRRGYRVDVVADTHTADGLVGAVVEYYTKEQ
jgi:uroporphyrinogen III methyltransferase/synthase